MTGRPIQPLDEWDFVPDDDDPGPARRQAMEDAALHIESRQAITPAEDPGVSDVVVDPTTGGPDPGASYFADEEPDDGSVVPDPPEDDHEPDLEEILESQHYAFGEHDRTQ